MVEDTIMVLEVETFKVLVVYTFVVSTVYTFKISIRDNLMVSGGIPS